MKTKSLCASALLTVLGLSVVGTPVLAAGPTATELAGTGKVTVEEGQTNPTDPTDPMPNPVDPEKPITPGEVDGDKDTSNTATGSLAVTHVSKLDFETIKISGTAIKKNATPVSVTRAPKEGETTGENFKIGNYVVFSDIRSGKTGYKVNAKMTKQFAKGEGETAEKLKNASISFSNASIYSLNNAEDLTNGTMPTITNAAFELGYDEKAPAMEVVAATGNQGKGTFMVEFGHTNDNPKADTTGNSVALNIPASTASTMTAGDYNAEITWSIVAAE